MMQFPLPDVTYVLHNKNPLLNTFSPIQSSTGTPFRMVTQCEMIICELCLGEKQGERESFFSEGGSRAGLQDETGGRSLSQVGTRGWMQLKSPK